MSWRDRRDHDDGLGRPGGDWQGVRPSFDNPMTWSVSLGRAFDIAVRLHVVFILYVVIRLARSLVSSHVDEAAPGEFKLVAVEMVCLFGLVLLHEFGHCFACRRSGGEANEILMWPLGGLAFCRPEPRWRSHLITAVGGPLVNVAIFVVLAPVLGVVTGTWWTVAVPNPLGYPAIDALQVGGRLPWWLLILFTIHDVNVILLLFNLLPIFPLDGGRICQACLWPRFGYVPAMRLAVYTGYIGAIGLLIFGAVVGEWMLIAIAAFGGITCYMTIRQLQFTESLMGGDESIYAESLWGGDDDDAGDGGEEDPARPRDRRADRRAQALAVESAEVDRILAKIGESGMQSVSRREKRLLERVTQRKQRERRS